MTIELIGTIARDAFWSGLAALGFAFLFSVPQRLLWGCAIAGAAGHAARTLMMHFGLSIEPATLFAALLVGFIATLLSRYLRAPAAIFNITGAIPMVPGIFAYRTMIGILSIASADSSSGSTILFEASMNAVKTALILSALAAGIAAPRLLFRREKPVV